MLNMKEEVTMDPNSCTTIPWHRVVRQVIPPAVLLLSLLLLALVTTNATRVAAATSKPHTTTLSVNPTMVNAGSAITVSGAGFTPDEAVNFTFNGASGIIATVQADGSGNLPGTGVTIPSTTLPGTYTLTATSASGINVATTTFTVIALVLSPYAIEHGGSVVVSGTGFAPNEPVNIAIDGQGGTLATAQTDGSGNLPATTVNIPAFIGPGSYTLAATGASSGFVLSNTLVILNVAITATPATIIVGGTIIVTGSGFVPGESVSISLSGLGNPLASIQATSTGTLPGTFIIIPATLSPGSYTLAATGASGYSATTIALTLNQPAPVLALNVGSIEHGGTVTVTGTGFVPNTPVSLTLIGQNYQSATLATVQTDGLGNLPSTSITIPTSVPGGQYTLTASSAGGTATAGVNLTIATTVVTVSASSVTPGETLTVSGSGFAPNEFVTIALSGLSNVLATPRTDASGNLPSTTVTIPSPIDGGTYSLQALGASTADTAGAPVSLSSLVPLPVLPVILVATPTPEPPTAPAVLSVRWYIAGASNTSQATSTFALQNTQAQPADVQIRFYFTSGVTATREVTVPAQSRQSIAVASLGLPAGDFGATIATDGSLSVQALLTRPGNPSTTLQSQAAAGTSWQKTSAAYAALSGELAILNPGTGTARVQLRLGSGAGQRTATVTVAAHSESTVNLSLLFGKLKAALSVTSSQPLAVAFS
jgi:hypothetical protein